MENKGYIAPGAVVTGNVVIEEDASVWYLSVLRSDIGTIRLGEGSNIQDGCVVHTAYDGCTDIGENVSVGHKVLLHSCEVGDGSLIGMGSIVMDGAKIGKNCIIGAGSLITKNTVIPDGMVAFGRPAKVIRPVTEEEIASNRSNAARYVKNAKEQLG